ncbi:hypothetical protein [Planctopirus ephydatiae]|uniref:hypothetical protein n=1 Tax=Planctopirus ephydatiae TaxID=2528019 RepID=UPI00119F2F73|nr:hypothetical protein [Planctopirus ephydatiae]
MGKITRGPQGCVVVKRLRLPRSIVLYWSNPPWLRRDGIDQLPGRVEMHLRHGVQIAKSLLVKWGKLFGYAAAEFVQNQRT